MSIIESPIVEIKRTPEEVNAFVGNPEHFGALLPPQVTAFSFQDDQCSFTIQGMGSVSLRIIRDPETTNLIFVPVGKIPFPFELVCDISPGLNHTNGSLVKILIKAELNPFMKMLAEKPLQNLTNLMAEKLAELLNH